MGFPSSTVAPFPAPVEQNNPVAGWTPVEVADWVGRAPVGLPEYQGAFLSNKVDGAALLEGFTDLELREEFGITPIGHRRRIQRALRELHQLAYWR